MKFIKKHLGKMFILLMLIAIVVAALVFKNTIMFDESQAIYGSRTDGADKVKVTEKQKKEIINSLKEKTKSTSVREAGRVIYVTIHTLSTTTPEEAKALGEGTLPMFSSEQKSYFDIQFLIDNADNQNQYPILGYKHRAKETISWTKDRA